VNPPRELPPIDTFHFLPGTWSITIEKNIIESISDLLWGAITSRGCSRRCTFCSVWRFHDGKYRTRSPENIIAELVSRDEKCVDFSDDDSFGNLRRMEKLCQLVLEQLPGRTFRFLVRTDSVSNRLNFSNAGPKRECAGTHRPGIVSRG